MFLNVVQTPTDSSFYGTSQFISNGGTIALNICDGSGGGQKICFYHGDEAGNNWTVSYGDYVQADIYTEAYLIRSENIYYSVIDEKLAEVDVDAPTSVASHIFFIAGDLNLRIHCQSAKSHVFP